LAQSFTWLAFSWLGWAFLNAAWWLRPAWQEAWHPASLGNTDDATALTEINVQTPEAYIR
jgi:hypothetical protein